MCAKHGELYTHLTSHSSDSHFYIKHLYEDLVEIVTNHGQYLACDGGRVYIVSSHQNYDTKWHMEWYQERVAFRVNYYQRYLGVGNWDSFGIRAHPQLTECEYFKIHPLY